MDENSPWFDVLFVKCPIPQIIYDDNSFEIKRVNHAAVDQYGYPESEFLSRTFYELFMIDDVERVKMEQAQVYENNIYISEWTHLRKNGDSLSVHITAHKISYKESPSVLVHATNITDKKLIQKEVEHLKMRFQALVENSEDIITVTDREGLIVYVSPAFTKVTGFTFEEVQNTPGRDYLHPDTYFELTAVREELLLHPQKFIPMVNLLKHKDGSFKQVEGSIKNLLDEPAVGGFVSNFREITQRLKDQEKIRESEAILRAVFDSAMEGFVIADKNLKIQAYNKVAQTYVLSNTRHHTIEIGRSLLDFVSPDRVEFFKHMIPQVLAGKTFENSVITDVGVWINYIVYPIQNTDQNIIGVCIAGKDITEKKEFEDKLKLSERRYKALVNEGSDLINIIDFDGNYKLVFATKKSRLQPSAVGENAFQYVHDEDREKLRQELDLLHKVSRIKSSPYRFKIGEDKYLWMETVGTNLMDDPAIEGIVINSHDVTDTVNQIKAIEERNARLEEIAWIQSHLVRAPLASILGIIEILKTSESEYRELMPYLEQSAVQLDSVIAEITNKANDLST